MDYLLVVLASLIAAGLTLFSGFGLGTLLLPVFALFYPLEAAVAATAVVHLSNNLFKAWLLGKHASKEIVLRFGLPAIPAALVGAWLLSLVTDLPPLKTYEWLGRECTVTGVGLLIGLMVAFFAAAELFDFLGHLKVDKRMLPVGGLLSGLVGGISGHQGALRSAFLLRWNLTKEVFIASGVICAVIVDLVRLPVYAWSIIGDDFSGFERENALSLLLTGVVAAFLGSYLGAKMIRKVTMEGIRRFVGALMLVLAVGICAGVV